jgi:hypothetical protein
MEFVPKLLSLQWLDLQMQMVLKAQQKQKDLD